MKNTSTVPSPFPLSSLPLIHPYTHGQKPPHSSISPSALTTGTEVWSGAGGEMKEVAMKRSSETVSMGGEYTPLLVSTGVDI